ncbi:MAG: ComF family protein [Verrucomicrobiota bacterium]
MWKQTLDLIYPPEPEPRDCTSVKPPFCQLCGEPYEGQISTEFSCTNCHSRRWWIRQARAAYRAEGDVKAYIRGFKYSGKWHYLPTLGDWLVEGYDTYYRDGGYTGLVPIPLHWLRYYQRGFNQAKELARRLATHSGIPVLDVLKRHQPTRVQASLRRLDRLRNCRHAFCLRNPKFEGKEQRLLIIDDVFTTGATANACAKVLRDAGCREINVLTVARG